MVVDCGFDVYQLPVVPRACRSPRGRRQKLMRIRERSEFEVLAQVAGKFSGEHEIKELEDNFVVNNFLETMEDHQVKPKPLLEKPSQVLSKDWLALGPSLSSSSPITHEESSISRPKIDGKRKICSTKRGSCSSQESQNIYPLKKRKLLYQPESREDPSTVKFGIKSLKISELLVDIPESATIGSLKGAVVEAVTQILKDGLNIGVLLRGKTIIDDSKTLLQIGIPCADEEDDQDDLDLSSLGFTLEPRKSEETTTITTLTTASPNTRLRQNRVMGSLDSTETVAAKYVAPLRMKPASQAEMVQRRIRRPFTVSEVEALVQAVEKIGTGRWRDVKSHAFDHVNHRTYVDLKDKWKTLVHTAKISARQRRGEPVPQELLDRVLAAHAFWSDRT